MTNLRADWELVIERIDDMKDVREKITQREIKRYETQKRLG